MTITATMVDPNPGGDGVFRGDARLYRLSEPVPCGWDNEGSTDHVIVSAVVAPYSGPETYIFPASADGKVMDWIEMDGSFQGGLDHAAAIAGAGWVEGGAS